MKPKISIITANYNKGKYIEDTIKSIVAQNYDNIEYIVIDGCSTDNSLEIIRKYRNHITYFISEPDDGMTDALIKGFKMATGEILAWLNSDDNYVEGALSYVAEMYSTHEFDFLYGDGYFIDKHGSRFKRIRSKPTNYLAQSYGVVSILQPSCFWSRKIFDAVGGFNPEFKVTMDGDLFTRILAHNKLKTIRSKKPLSEFRIHPEQSISWAPEGRYKEERERIKKNYKSSNIVIHFWHRFFYKYYSFFKSFF